MFFKTTVNIDKYLETGIALYRKQDYNNAIEYFNKIIDIDPANTTSYLYLSSIYESLGKYQEAEKMYMTLLKLNNPNNNRNKVAIFMKLSTIYKKNREYDKQYLELRKVLEIDSSESQAHFELGIFLAGQGYINEAIDEFKKVTEIDSQNIDALLYLGLCYASRNWWNEAKSKFRKILEIDKNHPKAHMFLGYIYKDEKKPDAINEFTDAMNNSKGELYYKAALLCGLTSIEQGFYDKAISIFESELLKEGIPSNWIKEYKYNLAWAHMFKGNSSRAVEEWNEIANIDINFYNVADLIKSLDEVDMESLEDDWKIYCINETLPNIDIVIGHPKKYDIELLNQEFSQWKHENQELLNLKFVKGIPRNSARLAKANSAAFKKTCRMIVEHYNLIIEEEQLKAAGLNYICHSNTKNKKKVLLCVRNWVDELSEQPIYDVLDEIKSNNCDIGMFITCGKFSRAAKQLAKKNKLKIMGAKALDKLLVEI